MIGLVWVVVEKRRKQRQKFDCALEISWRGSDGSHQSVRARSIDLSDSGICAESSFPIELLTDVHLRAEQYGLTGSAVVRRSTRQGSKYILGLEFRSETADDASEAEPFVDYYELLQISPNAEPETIHRVFRIMAARYHPDNSETGDHEKFLLLSKGYEVLSDTVKRAAYDGRHSARRVQPLPVFGLKEFAEGLEGEVNRRLGILSLLYNRRRTNPDSPGISLLDLETVMSFPREHLEFAIWFLREKEYIRTGNISDYHISAGGVEYLESEVPSKGVLSKLLHGPRPSDSSAHATEYNATPDEPVYAVALARTQ